MLYLCNCDCLRQNQDPFEFNPFHDGDPNWDITDVRGPHGTAAVTWEISEVPFVQGWLPSATLIGAIASAAPFPPNYGWPGTPGLFTSGVGNVGWPVRFTVRATGSALLTLPGSSGVPIPFEPDSAGVTTFTGIVGSGIGGDGVFWIPGDYVGGEYNGQEDGPPVDHRLDRLYRNWQSKAPFTYILGKKLRLRVLFTW